jgi:succinate-semialdehyde dehydrogenase/glutarate-semialdehyde dehydrogenase
MAAENLSTHLLIGGAWRPAQAGASFAAASPATGEQLGLMAEGTRADAGAAVAAAAAAFGAWERETAFARGRWLHRIAEQCASRRDELARAATLDQGKPLSESYDEVDELVAMWHAAAEDGIRIEGSIPASSSPGKRILVLRRPVGPVAVVTPWNWPYTMPTEIVAPALAAGNTVVWTPASSTAYCSGLLAQCIAEADLPAGVFNFVTGPGPVVGDELVGHPQVAAVGFIGSTATGLQIARRGAGKRLLLEMGGNGPLVVLEDADLEAARAPRSGRSTTRPSPRRWTSTWPTRSRAVQRWWPAASGPPASLPSSTGRRLCWTVCRPMPSPRPRRPSGRSRRSLRSTRSRPRSR